MKKINFYLWPLIFILMACQDKTILPTEISEGEIILNLNLGNKTAQAVFYVTTSSNVVPATLTWDGSLSADPEGKTLSYAIRDLEGNIVSTQAKYVEEVTEPGNYTRLLTVTDEAGNTSTMVAQITLLEEVDPVEPIDQSPQAVFYVTTSSNVVPATLTWDGSLSADPEGKTLSYAIRDLEGNIVSTQAKYVEEVTEPGNYTRLLTVTDEAGNTSTMVAQITLLEEIPVIVYTAGLKIVSMPDSVYIVVNNKYVGQTDENGDLTVEIELEGESETVLVTGIKNGYYNSSQTAELNDSETTEVNLVLTEIVSPPVVNLEAHMMVKLISSLNKTLSTMCEQYTYEVDIITSGATEATLQVITPKGTEEISVEVNQLVVLDPFKFDEGVDVLFILNAINIQGNKTAISIIKDQVIYNLNP